MRRERPPKHPAASPTGVTYAYLWHVAERAWAHDPFDRPSISDLVPSLRAPIEARGPSHQGYNYSSTEVFSDRSPESTLYSTSSSQDDQEFQTIRPNMQDSPLVSLGLSSQSSSPPDFIDEELEPYNEIVASVSPVRTPRYLMPVN